VAQSTAERNYHIFYQLCEAAQTHTEYAEDGPHKDHLHSQSVDLHLCPASAYLYLNRSECFTIEGVDDFHQHEDLQHAMDGLNLKQEDASSMFEVCAAILHLGNIVFDPQASGDGSVIRPGVKPDIEEAMRSKGEEPLPAVQLAAKLLKVRHDALQNNCVTTRKPFEGKQSFKISILRKHRIPGMRSAKHCMAVHSTGWCPV
jgi:myosin heavy subunit